MYTNHTRPARDDVSGNTCPKRRSSAYLDSTDNLAAPKSCDALVSVIQPFKLTRYGLSNRDSGGPIHGERNGFRACEISLISDRNITVLCELSSGQS